MNTKNIINEQTTNIKTVVAHLKACDFNQAMLISTNILEVMADHGDNTLLPQEGSGGFLLAGQAMILSGLRLMHAAGEISCDATGNKLDHEELIEDFMGSVATIVAIYSHSQDWETTFVQLLGLNTGDVDEDTEIVPVGSHDSKSD